MNKILPVIWSPLAESSYLKILEYIISKWSLNAAKEFDKKVETLINKLAHFHKLCPLSKKRNLRRCVVTPQTTLVYRIEKNAIELVAFIDNRSDHEY